MVSKATYNLQLTEDEYEALKEKLDWDNEKSVHLQQISFRLRRMLPRKKIVLDFLKMKSIEKEKLEQLKKDWDEHLRSNRNSTVVEYIPPLTQDNRFNLKR